MSKQALGIKKAGLRGLDFHVEDLEIMLIYKYIVS